MIQKPGVVLDINVISRNDDTLVAENLKMVFGWFKKLKSGLSKSSDKISGGIKKILKSKKIDDETLEDLEELLISSDLGVSVPQT